MHSRSEGTRTEGREDTEGKEDTEDTESAEDTKPSEHGRSSTEQRGEQRGFLMHSEARGPRRSRGQRSREQRVRGKMCRTNPRSLNSASAAASIGLPEMAPVLCNSRLLSATLIVRGV